jgi:hypothetical protein
MSSFIDECDRHQGTLLPETIDEYVSEENPVRVIDAFVGALDLGIGSDDAGISSSPLTNLARVDQTARGTSTEFFRAVPAGLR